MKALFLDFDGTLVNSLPPLYDVYCSFLEQLGHQGSQEEFDEMNGFSLAEIVVELQRRYQISVGADQIEHLYLTCISHAYRHQIDWFPQTTAFLDDATRKGLRLLIVSSGNRRLIEEFLRTRGWNDRFEAVITPEQMRAKPHPDLYLHALQISGLPPAEALAIEDSVHGVTAAEAAGIPVVSLTHGSSASLKSSALFHAASWNEVGQWLEQQKSVA